MKIDTNWASLPHENEAVLSFPSSNCVRKEIPFFFSAITQKVKFTTAQLK